MPQRDQYHDALRSALIKDGWSITHDPLSLSVGVHKMFIDLGAERLLAAERGSDKIAVELKNFLGASDVAQFEDAVGQYIVYKIVLAKKDPDRRMVLAVPTIAFDTLLQSDLGRMVREEAKIEVLAFDPQQEVIQKWVK